MYLDLGCDRTGRVGCRNVSGGLSPWLLSSAVGRSVALGRMRRCRSVMHPVHTRPLRKNPTRLETSSACSIFNHTNPPQLKIYVVFAILDVLSKYIKRVAKQWPARLHGRMAEFKVY